MKATLVRDQVLRLYFRCREAERSVHKSLGASWSGFQEYYDGEKRNEIAGLIEMLRSLTCGVPPSAVEGSEPSERGVRPLAMLRNLILNRWKQRWNFEEGDLAWIAATLQELLRVLADRAKPAREILISLRKRLWECQWAIEQECAGMRGLSLASRAGHFWQTEGVNWSTVEEVMRRSA
jgi:hypothetical protein